MTVATREAPAAAVKLQRMERLRVLLADDHAVVLEGLSMLIETQPDMEVVAQARSGREAVQLCIEHTPDVAVLDVSMSDLDGPQAATQIIERCPRIRVLALTRHAEQSYVRRMLDAGASGYVLKRSAVDALIHAIRTVAGGGMYIDRTFVGNIAQRLAQRTAGAQTKPLLSGREEEVLRLLAWGIANKEVAVKLQLSVKTIESYKAGAMLKLGLKTRADLVRHALAERWLVGDEAPE